MSDSDTDRYSEKDRNGSDEKPYGNCYQCNELLPYFTKTPQLCASCKNADQWKISRPIRWFQQMGPIFKKGETKKVVCQACVNEFKNRDEYEQHHCLKISEIVEKWLRQIAEDIEVPTTIVGIAAKNLSESLSPTQKKRKHEENPNDENAPKKRKHEENPNEENALKKEVYIVVEGEDYEGSEIQGVYFTMNKASNFVKDTLSRKERKGCNDRKWEKEEDEDYRWSEGSSFIKIVTRTLDYNWHDDTSS